MPDNQSIKKRIEKDIAMFSENIKQFENLKMDSKMKKTVELSKMYASDAKSYLDKEDYYTSFSCISYAHGLLDAVKEINGA